MKKISHYVETDPLKKNTALNWLKHIHISSHYKLFVLSSLYVSPFELTVKTTRKKDLEARLTQKHLSLQETALYLRAGVKLNSYRAQNYTEGDSSKKSQTC